MFHQHFTYILNDNVIRSMSVCYVSCYLRYANYLYTFVSPYCRIIVNDVSGTLNLLSKMKKE